MKCKKTLSPLTVTSTVLILAVCGTPVTRELNYRTLLSMSSRSSADRAQRPVFGKSWVPFLLVKKWTDRHDTIVGIEKSESLTGIEPMSSVNTTSWWSEMDFNKRPPDFKSSTLTVRPCCLRAEIKHDLNNDILSLVHKCLRRDINLA